MLRISVLLAGLLLSGALWAQQGTGGDNTSLKHVPALRLAGAENAMMLAAARSGKRIVGVGDHGVVLLSDDDGAHFRQATAVPTRATLNAVTFADDKEGWAVGHWGLVLHTTDGGENWAILRSDTTVDQPLFSVWFKDRQHGFAAGLWSLLLETRDGGVTWNKVALPVPSSGGKADRNLFQIFSDGKGGIFVVAEQGLVYHSRDEGATWEVTVTGNKGTFWSGTVLDDGTLLVGGLSGKLFRSSDAGKSWSPVDTGTKSSLTGLQQLPDGQVLAIGLDGVSLVSRDRGATFVVRQRSDRASMTAVVLSAGGKPVVFAKRGGLVVLDDTK